MLESRAERSAIGASLRGARHSSSRRWLEFSESQNLTELLNHTSKQTNDPSTISASDFAQACFDLHERDLFLRPDQRLNSEARNRNCISITAHHVGHGLSTAETIPGRVGRGERDQARRGNSAPRSGPHIAETRKQSLSRKRYNGVV